MRSWRTVGACMLLVGLVGGPFRLAAQTQSIDFAPIPDLTIVEPPLSPAYVTDLMRTLDAVLSRQTDAAKWADDAHLAFWRFANRLATGVLAATDRDRVVEHLDALKAGHPKESDLIDRYVEQVRTRMIGMVTPEIEGKDYEGVPFKLSDYRGKVVVLTFSGEWCGPCRSEYPYQKFLMELYKDRPFTVLTVNSDASLDVAKKAKVDHGLTYRSWWDGYAAKNTSGPIATTWAVTGWPTIYVLDAQGVIRFHELRHEDLIKGVNQLMDEMAAKAEKK
jgi:thiol-disulfide isomerase/thioredoxin